MNFTNIYDKCFSLAGINPANNFRKGSHKRFKYITEAPRGNIALH